MSSSFFALCFIGLWLQTKCYNLKMQSKLQRKNRNNSYHSIHNNINNINYVTSFGEVIENCTIDIANQAIIQSIDALSFSVAYIDSNINQSMISNSSSLFSSYNNFTLAVHNLNIYNYPTKISLVNMTSSCREENNNNNNNNHLLSWQNITYSCSDPNTVALLSTSLLSRIELTAECEGNIWMTKICESSVYKMCANCADPCVKVDHVDFDTKWADMIMFDFQKKANTWPMWTQYAEASAFNVSIFYNLSVIGKIYCAAFASGASINTPLAIAQSALTVQQTVNNKENLTGKMSIAGLAPANTYSILCYTESLEISDFAVYRSSLADTNEHANVVKTLVTKAPSLQVTIPFQGLTVDTVSPGIQLAFSFAPNGNITVIPWMIYLGSDLCPSLKTNNSIISSQEVLAIPDNTYTIAPESFSFQANAINHYIFFLETLREGCYQLYFDTYSDLYGNMKQVAFEMNIGENNWITYPHLPMNSTIMPSIPKVYIQSLNFSSSGLEIMMIFSYPTDEDKNVRYRTNFPCADLLNFTTVELCTCRFSSATLMRIFPPTVGDNLLMPGDKIALLPNKLRPLCPVNDKSFCSKLEPLTLSGIISNITDIQVVAVISAPSFLSAGRNLTIDISSSTGNGGRSWSLIQWTVLFNNDLHVLALEKYMNNNSLPWIGCVLNSLSCDTIPWYLMNESGYYTFRLTLTNFLGSESSISTVVKVSAQDLAPQVTITGPVITSINVNNSLTLRTVISLGNNRQCPSPLSISWIVFRGDQVDSTVVISSRLYRDARTLVIPAYILLPTYEYRFRVTVFCGYAYSYSEVTRYILPQITVPMFVNGDVVTTSLNNRLTFDISSAYGEDNVGMRFSWNCVQKQPLNSQGCKNFYNSMEIKNSQYMTKISFEHPETVFNYSSEYLISVSVTNHAYSSSAVTASQSLVTLPKMVQHSPILEVTVPQNMINNSFGYSIGAKIISQETFVAIWEILTTNVTISSRVFSNGGSLFYPAIIPSSLLSSRISFTFRLSAFAVTSSCAAITCMNKSMMSSSLFSIVVNESPSHGYLISAPAEGSDQTIFSIYAYNWQDNDLPLYYTFYQSNYNHGGYNLIRNRMQIYYMTGTLAASAPEISNNTVMLKASVADIYGAAGTAYHKVSVIDTSTNATKVIIDTLNAAEIVLNQFSPEVILPISSAAIDAIYSLDCDVDHETESCNQLMTVAAKALEYTVDRYNAGFSLVNGLCKYIEILLATTQALEAIDSIVVIFDYLNNIIQEVGFAGGNGSEAILTMISTADQIARVQNDAIGYNNNSITIHRGDGSNSTISIFPWLEEIVNALSLKYFSFVPFGSKQSFVSNQYFKTSMQNSYWFEAQKSHPGGFIKVEDIIFTKSVFLSNITSSYSYLNVINTLPSNASAVHSYHSYFETKYVNFTSFAAPQNMSDIKAILHLKGENVTRNIQYYGGNENNSSINNSNNNIYSGNILKAAIIYQRCNETSSANSVICSPEQTGGSYYTFPAFSCPAINASQMIEFICPLYITKVICLNYSMPYSHGEVVESSNSSNNNSSNILVACSFSLDNSYNSKDREQNESYKVNFQGSFSFNLETSILTDAHIEILPDPNDPKDPFSIDSSLDYSLSVIAIVSMILAFLAFTVFLLYKVKSYTDRTLPGLLPIIARTKAIYVETPASATSCVIQDDVSEEGEDEDLEEGREKAEKEPIMEAEMIEFQPAFIVLSI